MKRIHQSRSCTPALNSLEDRCLLSGANHGITEMMVMKAPTHVALMSDSISSNMNKVSLTAEVKALSTGAGVPAGKVTFEMVMPRGMKMAGMHAGSNKLGTAALKGGHATLTVKSSMVLNMELKIVYNGNGHFQSSTVTPAMLTMSGLMGTGTSTGAMGGMSM
jgi:Bacterial Ig-like domain (group 3)